MKPALTLLYIGNSSDYFEEINENKNISLIVFDNSLKAINYLNSKKAIDAIICDYNLRGNNGLYLFDWIKKQSNLSRIPFVLMSNEFNLDVFKLSFKKKVSDYYVSTVTPIKDVIERIEFLCSNRETFKAKELPKLENNVYKMPLSKRLFDIFVASSVLLCASPFLLLILLAIRL